MSTKTETKIQVTFTVETFVDLVGVLEAQVAELANGLAYSSDIESITADRGKMTKLADILSDIGMHNQEVQAYVVKKS